MKVMTVLGTRPEIIRLSQIVARLEHHCEHILVHTGQNYDPQLSDAFFDELAMRAPNHHLGVQDAATGTQVPEILARVDRALDSERPDKVLILGDTNSGLSAIMAKRRGIPVYHLEAGNRCYDDRVPEEVNRRIIDHCCDVWLPYTERSRANLLREGIPSDRIYVVGNPIWEVLSAYSTEIGNAQSLATMGVDKRRYILATVHRSENVDDPDRLRALVASLEAVREAWNCPVLISLHPRTRDKLAQCRIDAGNLRYHPPFGFYDFVALEKNALCVLTDSGTVQEECCLMRVPCVTLRDVTERPETLECGSNVLAGVEPVQVRQAVALATTRVAELIHYDTKLETSMAGSCEECWLPPPEYRRMNVADTVVRILLGVVT